MKWINGTVMSMGGMQACGLTLEKTNYTGDEGGYYNPQLHSVVQISICYTLIYSNESPGNAAEAPSVGEDTVVLLTGGPVGNSSSTLSLPSEVFPVSTTSCPLPSLPGPRIRYNHVMFATEEPSPRIIVCGGWDKDEIKHESCLVLNLENQRWDEITMLGQERRSFHAVVSVKNIGTYMIGGRMTGRTTNFLPPGSEQWVAGPANPVNMGRGPCALTITANSFLAIYGRQIREYQVDTNNPTSDDGWEEATKWPQLQIRRVYGLGCSKIKGKVVIAGGAGFEQITETSSSFGEILRSTEVLDLSTRKIEHAENLATPRRTFHIVTITIDGFERVFALAGYDDSYNYVDSVEEFDPYTLTWKPGPASLLVPRGRFGALVVPRNLICPV